MNEPAPRRRISIDPYAITRTARHTALGGLIAAATYALTMAGWWLQVHR